MPSRMVWQTKRISSLSQASPCGQVEATRSQAICHGESLTVSQLEIGWQGMHGMEERSGLNTTFSKIDDDIITVQGDILTEDHAVHPVDVSGPWHLYG